MPPHESPGLDPPWGQLVEYPADHVELAELVRSTLQMMGIDEPEEYEPGRFAITSEGVEVAIVTDERVFPAIRFDHVVFEVPEAQRAGIIDFANALVGRSSTFGSHWWVGDSHLWQQAALWAGKFDAEIFAEQLVRFIGVASDRTPEIRARFGKAA